jgi:hypothetical protein
MHSDQIAYTGKETPVWKSTNLDAGLYDITTFPRSGIIPVKPPLLRVNPGRWICPFFVYSNFNGAYDLTLSNDALIYI